MESVKKLLNIWMNDKEMIQHHNGDEESIKKEVLLCVQNAIESNFIILTQEELMEQNRKYHASMEGYEYAEWYS